MRTLFIAGGSASGKSVLAGLVVAALSHRGRAATVLRQDSFYCDRPDSVDGSDRHHFDFDRPEAIDWAGMAGVIEDLRAGRAADVPLYDFTVSKRTGTEALVPRGDVLVVDGTLVLHAPDLRPLADASVYVRAPQPLRRARRLARDVEVRGRDPEDIQRQLDDQVFPAHDRFVRPSAVHADLVLEAEAIMAREAECVARVLSLC